jgi:hypothetical protein
LAPESQFFPEILAKKILKISYKNLTNNCQPDYNTAILITIVKCLVVQVPVNGLQSFGVNVVFIFGQFEKTINNYVVFFNYVEWHHAEWRYAQCHFAVCRGTSTRRWLVQSLSL